MPYVQAEQLNTSFILKLSRPERMNALSSVIATEILEALQKLETALIAKVSDRPRCLIIQVEPVHRPGGRKIWIAGGDLKEIAGNPEPTAGHEYSQTYRLITQKLRDLPIPVICCLDGEAIGGGAEFYLAADLRLATESSLLHFKQLSMGLSTGYGGSARLATLVGADQAFYFLLTCARVDAKAAAEKGLIHLLYPDTNAMQEGLRTITNHIASLDAMCIQAQKQILNTWQQNEREQTRAEEARRFEQLWHQPAHRTALQTDRKS